MVPKPMAARGQAADITAAVVSEAEGLGAAAVSAEAEVEAAEQGEGFKRRMKG